MFSIPVPGAGNIPSVSSVLWSFSPGGYGGSAGGSAEVKLGAITPALNSTYGLVWASEGSFTGTFHGKWNYTPSYTPWNSFSGGGDLSLFIANTTAGQLVHVYLGYYEKSSFRLGPISTYTWQWV